MITPTFQKITLGQLQQLAPELYDLLPETLLEDEEDLADDDEDYDGIDLLYCDGDTHLDQMQYNTLKEAPGFYTPWAVNGSLVLENCDR